MSKRMMLLGLSALLSLAGGAQAQSNVERLEAELQAVKAEMAQMRAQQSGQWMTERRAEEIKALVADVLADTETRDSFNGSAAMAGYDGKFYLASADNTFRLNMSGHLQPRYVFNSRKSDGSNGSSSDPQEFGFTMRRLKLVFDGFIGAPKLEYKVQLQGDRCESTMQLEDIFVGYTFNVAQGLRIIAGRFPDSFARESMMSSKSQQTAERSAVANIFCANDDYVEGLKAEFTPIDAVKLALCLNDGLSSGTAGAASGTGFISKGKEFNADAADLGITGRVDVKLVGYWKEFSDVEAWKADKDNFRAVLGAGVHYEVGETGDGQAMATTTAIGAYDTFTQWTVDGLVKWHGLGIMAAAYGWHFNVTPANTRGDLDLYAFTAQAGYMLFNDKVEPFVRWEMVDPDSDMGAAAKNFQIVTCGVNYFLKKHSAKATLDVMWIPNNLNSTNRLGVSLGGIGALDDMSNNSDQIVIRTQFQLLF